MQVSPEILNLVPYSPGKPIEETQREYGLKTVFKLASNENPLGLSKKVKEVLQENLSEIYRYPDASCYNLREKTSSYYQVPKEWLSFGNGSNEIIDLLIRVFCLPGDEILTSASAFIAYKICAQVSRVGTHEVPMTADFCFNLDGMLAELEKNSEKIKLIFIANPNNPTGTYVNDSELRNFLEKTRKFKDTLVVLDEAYNEFVRATDYPQSVELMKEFEQLVVVRTFSKVFGLAGLRIGTLMARPEWVDLFNRIRNPFNVNSLAQVAAIAAMDDKSFLQESQKMNWQGLDYFSKVFTEANIPFLPSQANFLLIHCGVEAQPVFEGLLRKGVIVRPVGGYGLNQWLRVSVGNMQENEAAASAILEQLES